MLLGVDGQIPYKYEDIYMERDYFHVCKKPNLDKYDIYLDSKQIGRNVVFENINETIDKHISKIKKGEKFITYEMCIDSVKRKKTAIKNIPEVMMTNELIEIAVKSFGLSIEYIPDKFRTKDLFMLALKSENFFDNT